MMISRGAFFDSAAVMRDVAPKRRKFLSRFGAFVRTRARSLLNKSGGKSGKTSAPGQPPRKQVGTLRRNIFFAYERSTDNVVIGPVELQSSASGGDAPEALEKGGILSFVDQSGKTRSAKVQSRPFMQPAFDEVKQQISSIWRDS